MTTPQSSIRSAVEGWTYEDGNEVLKAYSDRIGTEHEYTYPNDMPVGLIDCGKRIPCYPTVLHAIGNGWKLLAPPQSYIQPWTDDQGVTMDVTMWEWWLIRD